MQSINPANGDLVREYQEHPRDEVQARLGASERAFREFRRSTLEERAQLLVRVAAVLRERSEECARLMAVEMGKPLTQGRAEVEKCAWTCEHFAAEGARYLAPEVVATDAKRSYVAFSPLGPVLAIMPWNFPFWQVFRFAVPAILAGNAGLLKHAGNVSGSALAIESIFESAGIPKGLFQTLLVGSGRVPELIESPEVVAVTLTGSTRAGKDVARTAGASLKKTVLELGGSDPYVILEDADLELAASVCASSRLINAGQSCIAAKRFIVVEAIAEAFERRFTQIFEGATLGDPLDERTTVGPLAREDLRDDLHRQVVQSVERGARLLLGGRVPAQKGAWYPPTVLSHVTKGMPAFDEETFGPVAAIVVARDEDDAIEKANDSAYGLGAAVFTRDETRGEHIAERRLHAGNCFVNALVKSDPRLPFGGVKESGYGRELSAFGIREFVNVKTVFVGR